jgi:hypothetical protein
MVLPSGHGREVLLVVEVVLHPKVLQDKASAKYIFVFAPSATNECDTTAFGRICTAVEVSTLML